MELIYETLDLPRVKENGEHSSPTSKWKKPPDDTDKLNFDGAIQAKRQFLVDSRVVARDNVSFLAATCKIYQGIYDPLSI
jgi:hypothetical protein